MTLAELRVLKNVSQDELAYRLETTQSSVSKIEARTDMHISTLKKYVEALGGTVVFVAKFMDKRYDIGL